MAWMEFRKAVEKRFKEVIQRAQRGAHREHREKRKQKILG
jgi:hypothetical protein